MSNTPESNQAKDCCAREVLVVQWELSHYRLPLYRLLQEYQDINVTVLYSACDKVEDTNGFASEALPCRSWAGFKYQPGLRARAKSADVIVLMYDIHFISSLLVFLLYRKKCLLWGHAFGSTSWVQPVRLLLARLAPAVLLYEEREVEQYVAKGVTPRQRLFFTGNTIEVSNAGISENSVRNQFLFVGRLRSVKRVDLLLKSFAILKDKFSPDVGVTIVGGGDELENLVDLSKSLGISDRVKFLGNVTSPTVLRELFDQSLAFVSPGHVGLSVLHSFAYGVPIVTQSNDSHAPEVHNITNGENGIIFEGAEVALAEVLERLASDFDWARNLGKNAHEYYLKKRTMPKMVERFRQAINSIGSK